jgi:RNA polymerase sigma-70 factor (ECF subfamily)
MQLTWRNRLDDASGDDTADTTDPAGSDLAIVRLAQADPRAFAPLYERYAPLVYHYCLRRLSHPETAADATSAVFTRAIAALPRFRPDPRREGSTFRSWLFTIAHNTVVDNHRRRRQFVSLDGADPSLAYAPQLIDPSASPEDHALDADEASRVRAVLARLPKRQRAIVELRLAGLSGAEIAAMLGMTESAVKSAQFRAYGILRDLLRDHDPSRTSPETPV